MRRRVALGSPYSAVVAVLRTRPRANRAPSAGGLTCDHDSHPSSLPAVPQTPFGVPDSDHRTIYKNITDRRSGRPSFPAELQRTGLSVTDPQLWTHGHGPLESSKPQPVPARHLPTRRATHGHGERRGTSVEGGDQGVVRCGRQVVGRAGREVGNAAPQMSKRPYHALPAMPSPRRCHGGLSPGKQAVLLMKKLLERNSKKRIGNLQACPYCTPWVPPAYPTSTAGGGRRCGGDRDGWLGGGPRSRHMPCAHASLAAQYPPTLAIRGARSRARRTGPRT